MIINGLSEFVTDFMYRKCIYVTFRFLKLFFISNCIGYQKYNLNLDFTRIICQENTKHRKCNILFILFCENASKIEI